MTGRQKKYGIAAAVAAVLILVAVWRIEAVSDQVLNAHYTLPQDALALPVAQSNAQEGARLAHVYGCVTCHGRGLTGGVILTGLLGTRLVAPNLTKLVHHRSDEQLAQAIRYGIKPDGTTLIGMPANAFVKSSDSDLAAIIAYLRTLPERPGTAPKTRWGFIGRAMLATDLLHADAPGVNRRARGPLHTPTDPVALGRYITHVQCVTCHGPHLTGSTMIASPGLRFSIIHYTSAAFMHFFTTGQGQIGHGTKVMTRLIKHRFHFLTKADIRGIYAYLNATRPKS